MRWVKRGCVLSSIAVVVAGLWAYRTATGSLPDIAGKVVLSGLRGSVSVARDANGVPTIVGENRPDVVRALGFVHAQERFFQMDLLRRRAAGELAELVGAGALRLDRRHRLHRMRARAKRRVENASDNSLLLAYTEGVNAGLRALDASPFEYLLLRQDPRPWLPEDSMLVIASMFFQLNDPSGRYESNVGLLYETLAPELAAFLTPIGTEWDAPIVGEPFDTPPIPPPGDRPPISSRRRDPPSRVSFDENIGSNNWAVAPERSAHGGAILASDMHLAHSVPNIWFRAQLRVGDHSENGVTLPGTPFLVAGSNGHIAWGFTNSNGDWLDLVEVEPDPNDPQRYLTPDGSRPYERYEEVLHAAGGERETLEIRETIWGPILDEDHTGQPRALRWIAHDDEGINLGLGELSTAETLASAMAIAQRSGLPPQNFVCVDAAGAIGWTIAGRIPKRFGFDGRRPTSWAKGDRGWDGWLAPQDYPSIVQPPGGVLWTANARVVDGEMLGKIGDGGYAFGARARQIRDDLLAIDAATEKDLLDVQLDDRAVFIGTWRDYFLSWVRIESVREALESGWTGHASTDSSGYRAVRELRLAIFEEVFTALSRKAREADERFSIWDLRQWDGPLWRLVSERPRHLVPKGYETWDAWMEDIVERTVSGWDEAPIDRSWGEVRMSQVNHPLSGSVPWLSRWLDMPSHPLSGDSNMPRAQSTGNGASQRLVVSPGREEDGLFHMPGGQSGHPLSPYYGAGHDDWLHGRPTPLLPGRTSYTLRLEPS